MKASKESFAYTPGLRVTPYTYVRRLRSLPLKGEILVNKGEHVNFDTVVARCCLEGMPHIVKVAELLNIDTEETMRYLLKKKGEPVKKGEPIAKYRALFGLVNKTVSIRSGWCCGKHKRNHRTRYNKGAFKVFGVNSLHQRKG
jgi:hypothetical protein